MWLMLLAIACASQTDPSWNTTPGRAVIVHTEKSLFAVTACARYGWTDPSEAMMVSGS